MDPILDWHDPLQGAAHEIISAMSALNMEPEPLEVPEGAYLSERDRWAKHAMEHLRAALELLQRAGVVGLRAQAGHARGPAAVKDSTSSGEAT